MPICLCPRTILITVIDSNGFSTPVVGVTVRFVGKNDDEPVLAIGSKVLLLHVKESTDDNFFLKRLLHDTKKAVELLFMSPAIHSLLRTRIMKCNFIRSFSHYVRRILCLINSHLMQSAAVRILSSGSGTLAIRGHSEVVETEVIFLSSV